MSYTPTVWVNGDTITATKLNKIENGIANAGGGGGGGALVVTDSNGTLDKTWQQISDAIDSGSIVVLYVGDDNTDRSFNFIGYIYSEEGDFGVGFIDLSSGEIRVNSFSTSSASGYPEYSAN